MSKIKRYSCGNGDGMYEDENGHYVEYSQPELKAVKTAEDYLDEKINETGVPINSVTRLFWIEILEEYANQLSQPKEGERFILPTDKELIEIGIIFNDGKLEQGKLTDMLAMANFIIDRLYENGDVSKKSSKEID